MTRLAAATLCAALGTLTSAGRADAQCQPRRPSDPCAETQQVAQVVVVTDPTYQPAGEDLERRGGLRTHGVAFETGHLLEPGTFQINGHAYGFVSQLGIGLHERIELSADVVAFGLFGAGLGGRVSLLPAGSNLKAVVGAKLWSLTVSPIKPLQLSGTLGYQSDRLNLHANVSEMPTEDGRVWLGTVGVFYEASKLMAFGADVGRIAAGDDSFQGVIAGIKLTGEKFDLDLTLGVNDEGALPLIGFTGRM